ncbi:biotin/lipoate A/B protein ligase family protein [Carboxydochorda subterranea]|uniref:Biotin/lipoate A/B protein ligase family protein n=1 Tax=Carboxydichorda subterranea TaxID=3109565 RepID=A0ABZ1BWB8_9FIRM|nr:biotin/lipoate A/B protein ligase family protein [Limnochorda sp. L945t]WRP17095.1 biotin/lipoate A/B protein ligase family protein [Limnochorda sp. L945t]
MERWRLLVDGPGRASWNMAVDEAVLESVEHEAAPPTVRFYRWAPPAVSLGYFQEWQRAVNENACRQAGVDVVRRPTGGRAVFHHVEVTYAVMLPPGHPVAGLAVMDGYRRISEALREGLRLLGVEADLARPAAPAGQGREALAGACFDSASRYELEWRGRKLVGSAQVRRASGAVLQHGSIPIRLDPGLTAHLLAPGGRGERFLALLLGQRAGDLSRALGREPGWDEVVRALVEGLGVALRVDLEQQDLTPGERARAGSLVAERYGNPEWNRLRPSSRVRAAAGDVS